MNKRGPALMDKKISNEYIVFTIFISAGIMLRFIAMSLGHNYDFESYCVVGEIAGNLKNVYANTVRYNYGPIFFMIQGTLYRLAQVRPHEWVSVFRVLIVSILTVTDLAITAFVARRYSLRKAIVFFINPVSIIITGLHNQFDNMAILFALLSILFYNEDEEFTKKDAGFVAMFTLSLVTKHIMFMLPLFLLLKKGLPLKKKALYAFVPPILFLLSFVPFVINNRDAFNGVKDNVFLYRSMHNAPLLKYFYDFIHFPESGIFVVYLLMMAAFAFVVRKWTFEKIVLTYLIAMVCFSSAVANQYLAIPMVALCVLDVGIFNKLYMLVVTIFLLLHKNGVGIYTRIIRVNYKGTDLSKRVYWYVKNGYTFAAWILLFALIYVVLSEYGKLPKRDRVDRSES